MTEFVWREERTGHAIRDALDRRHPERLQLRPNDARGVREGFDLVDQMWAPTIERASRLPRPLLHERVNGEYSFVETLRHLLFAWDSWLTRVVLRVPNAYQIQTDPRARVGDVVLLGANTLCGSTPEVDITVTTIYLDTNYVIDQVFWQYAAVQSDRLHAQQFAETIESEPAQVVRIGRERAGMLTPWLDELVALSVDGLRPLRAEVVAVKTFGLPERRAVETLLYHRPSGSQRIIDAHGRELRRELSSVAGEQALTAILDDSRLLSMALELAP